MATVIRVRASIVLQLLMINVTAFILQWLFPGFTDAFVLVSSEVWSRPWTLFTTMFLHDNFLHLFFNMYALFIFGPLIEFKVGRKRFLWLYVVSGLFASVAALVYSSALGASGAIMGILGAVIMLYPQMKVLFFFIIPMSMRTAGIIFALLDIFGAFSETSGVAHIAHLAGLAVGLFFGWYVLRHAKQFKQQFAKKSAGFTSNSSRVKADAAAHSSQQAYEDTIELTKDELDNYYKSGKL